MKNNLRRPAPRPGNQPMLPTPSLTDQQEYVPGETVVSITIPLAKVVRAWPAGNGRTLLKLDTAPDGQPMEGQFLTIVTDDPTIEIEVL